MRVAMLNENPAYRSRSFLLVGNDREQGLIHGAQAAPLIRENLEALKEWIDEEYQSDWNGINTYLSANETYLKMHQPDLIQEIEGIAQGSGLPYRDILLMNLQLYFAMKWIVPECSQFAKTMVDKEGNTRTFTMKTRDNGLGPKENIVLKRVYPYGLKMIEIGFAGIVTGPGNGINSRGVSLTSSGVWSKKLPVDAGMFAKGEILPNTHRILREMRTVDDLGIYLDREPRASGMNYIAASSGTISSYEVQWNGYVRTDGRDQVVLTNHYTSGKLQHLSKGFEEYASTHYRHARITELLPGVVDPITGWQLMSDHDHFPQNSICRHNTGEGDGIAQTTYGAFCDVEQQTMYVGLHQPCMSSMGRFYETGVFEEF